MKVKCGKWNLENAPYDENINIFFLSTKLSRVVGA